MPKRYMSKNSDDGSDFETDLFKDFNKKNEENSNDSDDSIKFDEEHEDDESDDQLLINSDDNDIKKDDHNTNIWTKNFNSGISRTSKYNENDDDDSKGSDDDDESDMPDAVSFSSSKQTALEEMKSAIKQIDKAKQQAKEKRKKIDEKYKEQKKKKLNELLNSKLPDEFLADLSDKAPEIKKAKMEKRTQETKPTTDECGEEDEGSLADTEDDFKDIDTGDDFIPLQSDRLEGVEVVSLQEKKSTNHISGKVLNFKEQMLYGKGIQKESMKSKVAKTVKRSARFQLS